jgi:hypothetical protein
MPGMLTILWGVPLFKTPQYTIKLQKTQLIADDLTAQANYGDFLNYIDF